MLHGHSFVSSHFFLKFNIVIEDLNCHKPRLNTTIQLQERSRFYFQHVTTGSGLLLADLRCIQKKVFQ